MKARHWFVEIAAALFVLLFLYTGFDKLRAHDGFAGAMNRSVLLRSYSVYLQWIIPFGEIMIAVFLVIPATRRMGLLLSTVLMAMFTAYVAYMLLRGGPLPCQCGGVIQSMSWPAHLVFNAAFFILGLCATIIHPKAFIAITGEAEHL